MTPSEVGEVMAAGCLMVAVYCVGGLHGLWLAWSQEERMKRWAARAAAVQAKINESEGVTS